MKILAIAGTVSVASPMAAVLRDSQGVAPAGATVTLFEGMTGLPPFSPDDDVEPHPAPVAALRALVGQADAVAICSTAYAGSVPGLLKNLLDWLVSSFEAIDKPVVAVSLAQPRPDTAHAELLEVLRTMMGTHLVDGGAHAVETDARAAFATGYRALEAAR